MSGKTIAIQVLFEGLKELMELKSLKKKYKSKGFAAGCSREEREEIIRSSLDCGGGGCENCSSCWLGGGSPWEIYQDYIDGKREIREINMEYNERYRQDRQIRG